MLLLTLLLLLRLCLLLLLTWLLALLLLLVLQLLTDGGGRGSDRAVDGEGTLCYRLGGPSVVGGVELLPVLRGLLRKLVLFGEGCGVGLATGGELGGSWLHVDAAAAAVVADAV